MHTSARSFLIALAAAALLTTAAGTASAARFSISESRFRSTWMGLSFAANGSTIRCEVTMEGSMHARTFVKSIGALLGYITRILVKRPCVNGRLWAYNGTEANELLGGTLSNTLPWHVTYKAFEGTLPNILGLRLLLLRVAFLVNVGGSLCTYASTNEGLDYVLNMAAGRIASASLEPIPELRLEAGLCIGTGRFSGTGSYTVLNTTTPMTVFLI